MQIFTSFLIILATSITSLSVEIAALLFWSFQLVPQAYTNWKSQSTEGLSALMMLSWTLGSLATAIYCIRGNVGGSASALFIAQPNLFMVFSITCWTQCIVHYCKSPTLGISAGVSLVLAMATAEGLGGVFLMQHPSRSIQLTLAVASLVFFAIGYIPQYVQIFDDRRVTGISLDFIAVDLTGSILSIVALALQDHFDPVSCICYVVVIFCDLGIVLLYYLLPLAFEKVSSTVEEDEGVEVIDASDRV